MSGLSCDSGRPTKQERVTIRMTLDEKSYARHTEAVAALVPDFKSQTDGDHELKVNYDLLIRYYGNVTKMLEAVEKICGDPDVVVTASCPELEQGRLLVYETLKRLEAVIKTVKEKGCQNDTVAGNLDTTDFPG